MGLECPILCQISPFTGILCEGMFALDAAERFASDSVIRWFESSYPSQLYHILYKECSSRYNIWFLFYLAGFILPLIVGKIVG